MTAEFDDHALQNGIDAAFEYGGLLLRALGYAALYAVASNYDCGKPMLAGVLTGDLVSHTILVFVRGFRSLATITSELALTGLVLLLARDQLALPDELPMRAIFGLAAFGACIGKFPGAFTTLGRH